MDYFNILNAACENESLDFNEAIYKNFIKYKDLLKEWNDKINLTAITDDEGIIKKHFIDSLKAFEFKPLFSAKSIIDVGTGAGFPGLPMKIVKDDLDIVLLDSLNKRINFLNQVISELELKGISAIHGRAEDFGQDGKYRESFDIAVSRAVANLTVLAELCLPFVKPGGYFIAMKGPSVDEEIEESMKAIGLLGGKFQEVIKVNVEETDLKHNLVVIRKIKETPKNYPRKAGTASKKPIK